MGNDELISDERWIQETLDSDEEVKASKQRMLSKALNDKSEIPRTFRMSTHSPLQPLAENSKELNSQERPSPPLEVRNSYRDDMKPSPKERH